MRGRWMRLLVVVFALTLVAAACGDGDDGDDAGAPPAADEDAPDDASAADGQFAIARVDFEAGVAVIANVGGAAASTDGMFVCQRPTYVPLEGGELAPGETTEVALSDLGATADDGEIGLYLTGDFSNADDIVSYVEWGSSGHGRSSVAVAAGLWEEGAALEGGASAIVATTDRPSGPDDWTTE